MMIEMLKRASDVTGVISKWILFGYVVLVTILAIIGVVFRMAGAPLSWNEELMRWLLIGIAYVGAAVALKERSHIGIEFFVLRMSRTLRKISIIVGYLAVLLFLVVVLVYGFRAAVLAQRQYGAILRIPMIYVKLNLPLGSLFMLVHMTYFSAGILTEKEETRQYLISGGSEI